MLKARLFTLLLRKPLGESPSKNFFRSCFFGKKLFEKLFFFDVTTFTLFVIEKLFFFDVTTFTLFVIYTKTFVAELHFSTASLSNRSKKNQRCCLLMRNQLICKSEAVRICELLSPEWAVSYVGRVSK